mgnify:CR=1 FL=1
MNQAKPDNVTAPQSVASSRLVLLWRKFFGPRPPKPEGPCKYCGEMTNNENPFFPGLFAHDYCRDKAWEERKYKEEERKKIELIKTAIRELEAEKQNSQFNQPELH